MNHSIKQAVFLIAGTSAIAALFAIHPNRIEPQPVFANDAKIPNPYHQGTLEPALRQTSEMTAFLRQHGSQVKVPIRLRYFKDAPFSDDPFRNERVFGRRYTDFVYPGSLHQEDRPAKEQVAVICDIYYQRNRQKGAERYKPKGYFLVGWQDGRVEAIRAEDVRLIHPGHSVNGYHPVYPGMKEWKADGIRLREFEFANGEKDLRPEAKAFFRFT